MQRMPKSMARKTRTQGRSFGRGRKCDAFASSTRVAASQLCCLVLLMIVTSVPCVFGQTVRSANLQVGHESWTFKDGAPPDVTCLAQTNDGFLWLCGGPNGLVRFDGTRFEPFNSPFGDRLPSANLFSLFVPPSGGLWVGYTFGGFSFLDNGRVTNYSSETGSVFGFAQDRDGIVWAGTSSGLWRFDHSSWQHIGVEWNAPAGVVKQVGFDSHGILWALVGSGSAPNDLVYLMPGIKQFKTARKNLSSEWLTWDADQAVLTEPAASPMSDSGEVSDERPTVYPVLTKSLQFVDRNNSLWIITPEDKPVVMRLHRESLHDAFNKVPRGSSETYVVNPFEEAALVDREGIIWFGDTKGIHRPMIRELIDVRFVNRLDSSRHHDPNGSGKNTTIKKPAVPKITRPNPPASPIKPA